jgi:hypothetical protein
VSLLAIVSLCCAFVINAGTVDLPVYKGELRIIVPEAQTRSNLVIRYRSKTREVVRIALHDLTLTNMNTKEVFNLDNRSAELARMIDHEGYWNTDVRYDGLNLLQDDYRIEGRLTLYMIGSQRTSRFSAYLEPDSSRRPEGSSIDWGVDN